MWRRDCLLSIFTPFPLESCKTLKTLKLWQKTRFGDGLSYSASENRGGSLASAITGTSGQAGALWIFFSNLYTVNLEHETIRSFPGLHFVVVVSSRRRHRHVVVVTSASRPHRRHVVVFVTSCRRHVVVFTSSFASSPTLRLADPFPSAAVHDLFG